jgi:hypothetical protein
MPLLIILSFLFVLFSAPAFAATRYVSQSGDNANSCAASEDQATPKLTLAAAITCMSAGDTLYIRAGTWTERLTFSGKTAGTATTRYTVSGYPGETVTLAANVAAGTPFIGMIGGVILQDMIWDGINGPHAIQSPVNKIAGFYMDVAHNVTIQRVEIKRFSYSGLQISRSDNFIVRDSSIHDMNSLDCRSGTRWYAIYATGNNGLVERVNVYNNPGGGMQLYPNPTNWVVRYSKVHDNNTCTTSDVGGILTGGDAAVNTQIYHNEIYGNGTTSGVTTAPCVKVFPPATNVRIWNNTCYNNRNQIAVLNGAVDTVIRNNIDTAYISFASTGGTNTTREYNACTSTEQCGSTGKVTLTTIATCTVSTTDFTLKAGASCINAGTNVGLPVNVSADIGAHEAWGASATASIDTNVMDITFPMNLNTPVLPSSGITGFSVNCTGTGCGSGWTVVAERKSISDTVVRLTISGITGNACAVGQTWTWSYDSSTGNLTDSALIGNSANQELLTVSNQAVTTACTGSPTTPPASGLHIHYKLDEAAGAGTAQDETVNNLDGTWTNSPSVTTGKTGNALSFPDGTTEVYLAVPYGSGLNPSSSSLSVCLGVLPHSTSPAQKIVFSVNNGTSQRFYIGWISGTWGIGIQGSPFTTGSEFPLVAEWTRLCLVANSGTDVATLYVNGVKGVSAQVVKSYTSYTFASNFKVGVGTFDVNYGGSTADDVKIYAATALTDQEVLDDYTAWNPVVVTPTGTYTQVAHQWQLVRKKADLSAENYAAASATVPVVAGGAVSLVTQVDCTAADCDPTGLRLYYSCAACGTAGEWLPVPDVAGSDGVSFYGVTGDQDIVSGAVTCCLSGALTANDGSTQLTAAAVPNIDMDQNASFVRRSVLKFTSAVTNGRTYCFQEYHQTGVAMATPTPSAGACLTIASPSAGIGF